MNGIDAITAVSTSGNSSFHPSDNKKSPDILNKTKFEDINYKNENYDSDDDSNIFSTESKSVDEIKKELQLKQDEVKQIDYTLEMAGIPLNNRRLVSVVTYPNGEKVMFDAFSGGKVSVADLSFQVSQSATVTDELTNATANAGDFLNSNNDEK